MELYPAYKDSGFDWIGEIPDHWNQKRLKFLASILTSNVDKKISSEEKPVSLCNYTDVYYNEKIEGSMNFMEGSVTEEEYDKFCLCGDDVIITKDSESPDDIAVPAYVPMTLPNTVCGYHLAVVRSYGKASGKYLFFLFKSYRFNQQFIVAARGITRFGLSQSAVTNSLIPLPPLPEQEAIASYLDRKTKQIDDLIAKKEHLIELKKEERAAIINQAVTKCLDPDVPMNDSGVEWLEEVPEHWDLSKMKYGFNILGGGTPSKDIDLYWGGDIDWITPKDMKTSYLSESEEKITSDGLAHSTSILVSTYSLLVVVRSGILRRTIPVGINSKEVAINQDLKALSSKYDHPIKMLYYFIKGCEPFLLVDWTKQGATVESIEVDIMMNFSYPQPPIKEQIQIVEYLDNEMLSIESVLNKEKKQIDLLKEYKTTLISEVVTGKLKVS